MIRFFLVVVAFMLPLWCSAAVTVSPRILDRTLAPRDIVSEVLVVRNESDTPVSVFPFVNNVTVGLEGGVEAFVAPSMSDRSTTLSSWIEVPRTGMDLKAGEAREVPITIRVNPDAEPGAYHATIAYARGSTVSEAEQAFNAGLAPGLMLNVTIEDATPETLSLSRFSIKRFVTSFRDTDVMFKFTNPGDDALVPKGSIVLYNQRGNEVGAIPVNTDNTPVAAGEEKIFYSGVPTDGLFGKYKALLTVRYGENQAAIYDTVYFYALPWKKLALAFGIFLACCIAIALLLHRRYARTPGDEESDADEVPIEARAAFSQIHDRDIVMKRK